MPHPRLCIALSAICLSMSGCAAWRANTTDSVTPTPLAFSRHLQTLDRSQLASMLDATLKKVHDHDTATTRVHLALLQGHAGYSGFQPRAAVGNLVAALHYYPKAWNANARAYLKDRLKQLSTLAEQQAALQHLQADNSTLHTQLQQAQSKLKALTAIERELNKQ